MAASDHVKRTAPDISPRDGMLRAVCCTVGKAKNEGKQGQKVVDGEAAASRWSRGWAPSLLRPDA